MSEGQNLRGSYVRQTTAFTVTFASGSPTSNVFSMPFYAAGNFWLPSGFTGFGLSLKVATAANGTFAGLTDNSNAYGTDVHHVLPTAQLAAVYAGICPGWWLNTTHALLWSTDGSGSGIPQSSARVVGLQFKA